VTSNRSNRRRTKGIPTRVIEAKAALERSTPEGQFGQVIAPIAEAIRNAIAAGRCPWCGTGPWTVLALHTYYRHGVDRHELRILADLPANASVCDPSHSREVAARKSREAKEGAWTPPPGTKGHERSEAMKRRASAAIARAPRRPCVVCGNEVPYAPGNASHKTCSSRCLAALRSQIAKRPRKRASKPQGGT
jgi:predicted nucleic acid-binding Zn ribbon protein